MLRKGSAQISTFGLYLNLRLKWGVESDPDKSAGTGGLTFEPPTAHRSESNFAADVGSEAPVDALKALFGESQASLASDEKSVPASSTFAERKGGEPSYQKTKAAFRALLANRGQSLDAASAEKAAPLPVFSDANAPLNAFQIGPLASHARVDVKTPPSTTPVDDAPKKTLQSNEMLDTFLVGAEGENNQVHLAFKEEVLGGMHVVLEQRPEGLFARFLVNDANARRAVEGSIDNLLVRFRDQGRAIVGYEVIQRS